MNRKDFIIVFLVISNIVLIFYFQWMRIDFKKEIQALKNRECVSQVEFDTFKNLTSDEFLRQWSAIARQNNNLKALGLGYHLCKSDIAPEDEIYDSDGTSNSSDGKMQ